MTVKERFNRAASTYTHHSEIQSITAQQLIQQNTLTSPQHVLDIGSGTGILTKKLAQIYPNSIIHAIDISENMLQELTHFSAQNIHTKCIDYLDYLPIKKFDLIGEKASHNSFFFSFDLICFPSLKFINPDLILSK